MKLRTAITGVVLSCVLIIGWLHAQARYDEAHYTRSMVEASRRHLQARLINIAALEAKLTEVTRAEAATARALREAEAHIKAGCYGFR